MMVKTRVLFLFLALKEATCFVARSRTNVLGVLSSSTPQNAPPSQTILRYTENKDGEESMSEEERMAAVRQLQKSFYTSPVEHQESTVLEASSGILSNLPLWRVGWVEVPARTNCLNVHEGQYTHMFETILNGPQPWYVGHLHLPGGFSTTRTGENCFLLKGWREELQDDERWEQSSFERSAVVGCLMRITDYRRLQDGRLCLLVQTLERFVVDEVVQEFPYSVANVQMLPDEEEMPEGLGDENFAKLARGAAVQQAFRYHPYEFFNTTLPIMKNQEYTSTKTINPAAIGKLLPFAAYSLDESLLDDIDHDAKPFSSQSEGEGFSGGSPPLEQQLKQGKILHDPPSVAEEKKNADLDGLETLLWLAVEELVRKTGFVLPTELLALQPSHTDYLDLAPPGVDFVHVEEATPKVSAGKYPAYRRQKRLSYTLPAILEDSRVGENMRQDYLNTPSTKARLQAVLERMELINSSLPSE